MILFPSSSSPASPGAGAAFADANGRLHAGVAGWPSGAIEALKWFGVAAMAADHFAILVLADPFHPLRTIGRLALPIFLILLARNLAAGSGAGRYWLRLLPFALASEIAWRAAEQAGAFRPPGGNILFTLALAALFWAALHRAAQPAGAGERLVAALTALLALVLATHVDYGPAALVLAASLALLVQLPLPWSPPPDPAGAPALAAAARRGRANPALARGLVDAVLWAGLFACSAVLAVMLNLPFFGNAALVALVPLGLLAARRLPDIKLRRAPWWVFYALYPAHVAILGLLGAALRG